MITLEELQLQIEEMKQVMAAHAGGAWPGAASVGWPHSNQMLAYREIHGPTRMSVDATHSVTFVVDFDSSVRQLYDANLIIKVDKVRSNVRAASGAAGGAQTSSAGGSSTPTTSSGGGQTSSSGGAQTSSAGSTHNHSITGNSGTPTGLRTAIVSTGSYYTGGPDVPSTQDVSAPHTHQENDVGGQTGTNSVGHTHSLNSHTHGYSLPATDWVASSTHTHESPAYTNASEGSHTHTIIDHTHTVSNHDHTVTIGTHTHTVVDHTHTITMTYGIYEGPAPSTPAITITINGTDRTTALGGPWDDDVTLNIRQYLREAAGNPYWQQNTIVLTSTELIDLEVTCKSLVVAAPPFAVNL